MHAGPVPELHVVRSGDTLWDICWYYFNDPWQWPKVWSYNPQISNPHWIYPGDLVRLLPRGVFAQQAQEPEVGQGSAAAVAPVVPVDNVPPPAQRTEVGIKQTAFLEKSDLDRSMTIDGAVDEKERAAHMELHVASMKNHINALGAKAYQAQFDDTPDYVIMFVPGEHFLSAALEHAPDMWDYAFDRRVLIATPTNLIAIARTVAAVWRQEKLAGEARQIAELGKELHARLVTMGAHVSRLGKNLETAMGAYNAFVGSLESQVMTSAKRFETLNLDTAGKAIEALPMVEQSPRPLTKLAAADDTAEAAE